MKGAVCWIFIGKGKLPAIGNEKIYIVEGLFSGAGTYRD
jgi:hypothetical protein